MVDDAPMSRSAERHLFWSNFGGFESNQSGIETHIKLASVSMVHRGVRAPLRLLSSSKKAIMGSSLPHSVQSGAGYLEKC
jgi:hypothetical protein